MRPHVAGLLLLSAFVGACGDARTELISAPRSDAMRPPPESPSPSANAFAGSRAIDAGVNLWLPCQSNDDCRDEEQRICHPTALHCVECVSDGHCDEVGEQCSSVLGECAVPCSSNAQCTDDDGICDTVVGFCVECVRDEDCGATWLCRRSECVNAEAP